MKKRPKLETDKAIGIEELSRCRGKSSEHFCGLEEQMPKTLDLIEVPANMLNSNYGVWRDLAYVYALDSTTIGVAGTEMPEWKDYACFTSTTPIEKQNETIILRIPPKFTAFYNVERKHKVVTLNSNTLLITITGNLIEEKKYPPDCYPDYSLGITRMDIYHHKYAAHSFEIKTTKNLNHTFSQYPLT